MIDLPSPIRASTPHRRQARAAPVGRDTVGMRSGEVPGLVRSSSVRIPRCCGESPDLLYLHEMGWMRPGMVGGDGVGIWGGGRFGEAGPV